MESDVREALRHLTTAFENHLDAVASRRSPNDAAVDDAYEAIALAFERYEDLLDVEYAEALPVVLDDADEDDDIDDLDDDHEDTDGPIELDDHADEDDDVLDDVLDDDLDDFNLRD